MACYRENFILSPSITFPLKGRHSLPRYLCPVPQKFLDMLQKIGAFWIANNFLWLLLLVLLQFLKVKKHCCSIVIVGTWFWDGRTVSADACSLCRVNIILFFFISATTLGESWLSQQFPSTYVDLAPGLAILPLSAFSDRFWRRPPIRTWVYLPVDLWMGAIYT